MHTGAPPPSRLWPPLIFSLLPSHTDCVPYSYTLLSRSLPSCPHTTHTCSLSFVFRACGEPFPLDPGLCFQNMAPGGQSVASLGTQRPLSASCPLALGLRAWAGSQLPGPCVAGPVLFSGKTGGRETPEMQVVAEALPVQLWVKDVEADAGKAWPCRERPLPVP